MRNQLRKTLVFSFFWAGAFVVLLSMFATSSSIQLINIIYTIIFTATLMIATEINERFIRSRFLGSGRYKLFGVLTLLNIVLCTLFNYFLFEKLIDYVLPGYYFISYYTLFDLLKFFAAFVGLTTLLGLSIEWFELQEIRKESMTAKFNALVTQVNPHFLFNSLTVLYTLSLRNSKETSTAIIKLSDILRYVIYKTNDTKVSLASEAAVLRDYIDLQRYRVHPTTQIDFAESLAGKDSLVAPMLFLPLVENAFKHGVHGETENAFVKMSLWEKDDVINFTIINNKSKVRTSPGIGLQNLKERLNLLYPGKHTFTITETENEFDVTMQLHDRGR